MVELRNRSVGETTKECHLVTGGGGYAGLRLGKCLLGKGHSVVLFDIRKPIEDIPDGINFIQGDIRNYEEVLEAFQEVDCVYHLASYGMSGREQLNTKLIEEVNVQGTNNVIKACEDLGIERLVYTSTFNVVFGGQVIENGDETLPYLPLEKHPDNYSRTKSLAEMAVLGANGRKLKNGKKLNSCALRLAGVYGPGEQRHLPRIVSYIEQGLFSMVYGPPDSLVEFLHVDNLVQAHWKAGEALSEKNDRVAAGQAYFISDCKPVNNFEFFRPLVEGLGYTYPTLRVPLNLVYFVAFIIEMVHSLVGRIYNFQPLLTRTEVYKTGVTHYFNNGKAKRELGYQPTIQNEMDPVVEWFKSKGHGKSPHPSSSYKIKRLLVNFVLAAIFFSVVMSFLPTAGHIDQDKIPLR